MYNLDMFEVTGIILLALIFFGWDIYIRRTDKHGAPFVPLEPDVVESALRMAKVKKGDVFYELGSGDGRLVIAAALRGAKAVGVELSWTRVIYSRFWIFLLRLQKNAKIIHKNFFDINLSDADVVCLFLLQETNEKIQNKLKKELKKGTRVVSVAFTFPNWEPEAIDLNGPIYGPIYLYTI